jgi:hypothetical protein
MKRTLKILAVLFGLIGFFPGSASALDLKISQRKLSPAELFNRCYTHLTGLHLSLTHPLRAAVVAGTISPVDACMQVLAEANLGSAGTVASTKTVGSVNESLAVLRAFSDFHHTLTENPDIENSVPESADYRMTRLFFDEGEFGLHFTRALFTPGVHVSDIVKLPVGLEALRDQGSEPSVTSKVAATPFTITMPTVQIGKFLGVRLMTANAEKTALTKTFGGHTYVIHHSDGGGVIGTPAYLLSNFGRALDETMNGGTKMPRRLARAIYKDLLCRDIPVIRSADATPFVQTNPTASTPPFRTGNACMQCHASIDPMAGTARNFSYRVDYHNPDTTNSVHLFKFPATLSAENGVVDSDPDFYKRPSNGRLFFRSYDGTLVDRAVSSIADLGSAIADTNDFYACVASRYYKFFTGITANLQDIGDPGIPAMTSGDLFYRNEVIRLGQDLKTSQNLQSLIREILSSDVYQRASNHGSQ